MASRHRATGRTNIPVRRRQGDNSRAHVSAITAQEEDEAVDKNDDISRYENNSRPYDLSQPLFSDNDFPRHFEAGLEGSGNDVSMNYANGIRSTSPFPDDIIDYDIARESSWREQIGDGMDLTDHQSSDFAHQHDDDGDVDERHSHYGNDDDDYDDDPAAMRPPMTTSFTKQRRTVSFSSHDEYDYEGERDEEKEEDENEDYEGEMLDQSSAELKATIDELEKRYDTIENEGNEWKTRYETQTEMNQQLEKQILLLQEKVEEAKRNLKEAGKSPRDNRAFDDLSDASPQMVKALEREKHSLFSQLRDLEWRLDQESKAYHKANDERKQYVLEINATKGSMGELKAKQRQMMLSSQESPPRLTARSNASNAGSSPARSYRDTGGNIPEDQRILDPRYGPIRKTAGVKALPSLDSV